jgi:hypothetical protein
MFFFLVFVVIVGFPAGEELTYAAGFRTSGCFLRMVCEKPKHVGTYNVLI